MKGHIIILSAPSGSGKSSIISRLINEPDLCLGFSISATSRPPRGKEKHGVEYYFLSPDEFDQAVSQNKFVEWEEVYPGTCYGTLRSEVERVTDSGRNLIMDIDVKGAASVKKCFPKESVSIFIMPPSIEELERRLKERGTDSEEVIDRRIHKAEYEISFAPEFDYCVVNDSLEDAIENVKQIIHEFISK